MANTNTTSKPTNSKLVANLAVRPFCSQTNKQKFVNFGEKLTFFFPSSKYVLSRVAFVNTHLVFAYWLLFITNDPFHTGLVNTIDVKSPLPADSCTPFDATAAWNNTFWFLALWWLPHSGLSRNRVKALFGSSPTNPLDRPVFAFIAPISWLATLLLWQPVSDCHSMDVLTLNPWALIPRAVIILVAVAELLGLFYLLPSHVFGTDRHTWLEKPPVSHDLIVAFPYALGAPPGRRRVPVAVLDHPVVQRQPPAARRAVVHLHHRRHAVGGGRPHEGVCRGQAVSEVPRAREQLRADGVVGQEESRPFEQRGGLGSRQAQGALIPPLRFCTLFFCRRFFLN
jgi:hypothetical protein